MFSALSNIMSGSGAIDVRRLLEPTRMELGEGLQWLAESSSDLLILYYSGHAQQYTSGSTYLICSDSEPQNVISAMGARDIGQMLSGARDSTLWLILDCCYAEDVVGEIREGLPWDVGGVIAHVSSGKGLITVNQRSGTHVFSGLAANNSSFTRSLLLALNGIGQQSSDFSPMRANELAYFEATRLDCASPVLSFHGLCREFRLSLARRVSLDPFGVRTDERNMKINRRRENLLRSVVSGSLGQWSFRYARGLYAAPSVIGYGRGLATLSLTANATDNINGTLFIKGVSHTFLRKIQDADFPVVGTVEPGETTDTNELPLPWKRLHLPRITAQDLELSIAHNEFGDLDARISKDLEKVSTFAEDSWEAACFALRSLSSRKESGLSSSEIQALVHLELGSLLESPLVDQAIRILASTPWVPVSRRLICSYIEACTGVPYLLVERAIQELVLSGICICSHGTMWIPPRMRESLSLHSSINDGIKFLEWSLSTARGTDRRHGLALLAGYLEDPGWRNSRVVKLLASVGTEFTVWLGARTASELYRGLISCSDVDDRTDLYLNLGDALRLSDDYMGSERAFRAARSSSRTESQRLRSDVGIVSARKNSSVRKADLGGMLRRLRRIDSAGGGPSVSLLAARSLFQSANLLFAQSNWSGAEANYAEAADILDAEEFSHGALLIDIWKGQGDIHLHQGEIPEAHRLLTSMLDLASLRSVSALDPRLHAKISQYAGDIHRHECLGIAGKSHAAYWWYRLAADIYRREGLALGMLITEFRLAQLALLQERLAEGMGEIIRIRELFSSLGNLLWIYKCNVLIALFGSVFKCYQPVAAAAKHAVLDRLSGRGLSTYQRGWGLLAFGDTLGAVACFKEVGANSLANSLHVNAPGGWLGAEY